MELATKPYVRAMSNEMLESSKMIGMWQALRRFNPQKNTKFTSFLLDNVKWQCLGVIDHERPYQTFPFTVIDGMVQNRTSESNFEILIDGLDEITQTVMRQRFIDRHTFKEIGKINGFSHETASKKVKKAIEKIGESS
jgi:DNA-directed RNA polymerase specialized sigma subunit